MIPESLSLILWFTLIGLDLAISARLGRMYQRDSDIRKLMFITGLLMCICLYAVAIVGVDSYPLTRNILEWATLPLMLAFILTSLHDRFSLDAKKCCKIFITGTILTVVLFAVPQEAGSSTPFLIAGLTIAILLSILQYSKKFDLPSVTLFFALPSFAVSYIAIGLEMTELALFTAFTAKGALIIAFEISKSQQGETTSFLSLQKELYAAEHNFNKLFEMLPDPAAIIDLKGTILTVSPNLITMSGFKKEELVGANFLKIDLISDSSKFNMVQNLGSKMIDLEIPPYEIEVQGKDGRKGQYEVNTSKINYRGAPAAMVVLRDLTERNRLLQEIQREQMRFQNIAESTGDWIWELNPEGKFTYSNPVASKIIGYTVEEIIGKKASDVFISTTKDHPETLLERVMSTPCSSPMITYCLHRDGRVLTMETHSMPMNGASGELVGYRGVSRDFTEKKEMENRLLKSERFAAIGELSTMVAHDLRNPLQGIANAIHCIKKTSKNLGNEKIVSLIPLVDEALKHADKIVRELLDYSTDIRLELKESDPKTIVAKALSATPIPENIQVIETTERKPKIHVDQDKIKRVIVNLVTNAVEAMPNGGTLTIITKEENGFLKLSIGDSGSGIPEEKIKKLWAPFVTTKAQGIGLGLAICKRLVDAHGGQISCESEKDKGTTFTLTLPISAPSQTPVEFYVERRETIGPLSNQKASAAET